MQCVTPNLIILILIIHSPVIALTEGGVIPATLIYLGSFYRRTELATRLAWFWGIQGIASAVSGIMASGLLQLQGVLGLEGWKWLFLVDGIITIVVSVLTWSVSIMSLSPTGYTSLGLSEYSIVYFYSSRFYLPRNAINTKGGIRGHKPWFSERQVRIAVTRVVLDDPSKRVYECVLFFRSNLQPSDSELSFFDLDRCT